MDIVLTISALVCLITFLAFECGKQRAKADRFEKEQKDFDKALDYINSLNDDSARNELREKFYRD